MLIRSRHRGLTAGVVACSLLLLGGLAGSAQALPVAPATFTPPCNVAGLKTAINSANAAPGSTIVLPGGCTYTLTSVDNTGANGPNGLPTIKKDVTIQGNNATIRRSSASLTPSFRIFEIVTGGVLTASDLTIQNGRETNFSGGGILVDSNSTLTLNNAQVTGNRVIGSSTTVYGAGIALKSGLATINGGVIGNNNASYTGFGGGVGVYAGQLTLDGVDVTGNGAQGGGGVYAIGAYVTLRDNTVVEQNLAFGVAVGDISGGGLSVTNSTLTIDSSQVTSNTANGSPKALGGGLALEAVSATVTNSVIQGNTADAAANAVGGGVSSHNSAVTFKNSELLGNTAQTESGSGTAQGGGLYTSSSGVTFDASFVNSNNATGPSGATVQGGGIYNQNSAVTLKNNSQVASNSPDNCAPPGSVAGCTD